jgi:Tfp pilus assembly protein PilX
LKRDHSVDFCRLRIRSWSPGNSAQERCTKSITIAEALENPMFHATKPSTRRRRGMALILILGMLAITIAVSYSLLRSQVQTTLLQTNTQTNNLARQAAETGLNYAIRKLTTDSWGGVGTTLTGNVDSQSSYSVSYAAGDASLLSGDPNYSELPFRVTITSTGTALNSGDNTLPTTYTMSAVLQLVRRGLNTSATPSLWSAMNGFTCVQWNSSSTVWTVNVDAPVQFQGPTCFLGKMQFQKLSLDPTDDNSDSRKDYIKDLKKKFTDTGVDYRHFTDDVSLGNGRQDADTKGDIEWLGVSVNFVPTIGSDPVSYANAPSTYKLYAGGPAYTVPNLVGTYGSTPTGQTIVASTTANPLGIYKAGGTVNFKTGTKFTGVLFSDGSSDEVRLDGTGVEINGLNLPALSNSSTVYQLPASMIRNNLVVKNNSVSLVRGLVINWENFVVDSGGQNTAFNLQGRLFAEDLDIAARTEWTAVSNLNWTLQRTLFRAQTAIGTKYYPDWMDASVFNLQAPPKIKFQPPSSITYHWPDWSQPIYTKATGDAYLRWNIVSWKDGT